MEIQGLGAAEVARRRGADRRHQFPGRQQRINLRLDPDEYRVVAAAAARAGMTPTGFCAHAAVAAARGTAAPGQPVAGTELTPAELAALQRELFAARTAVIRTGTNLNQAVAALNATGEPPVWLDHAVQRTQQPVRAGINPPQQPVWHASIRNHATDRTLTDTQWAHIAAEVLNAVGIAPHGDPDAVRWVAIRHADDHIHIVATLVRQDGATVWAWNERLKAQATARDLEERYGLHRVGPTDRTSHRRPGPAERNKAERQHRAEIPRDRLRRDVRAAAAAATDEADFLARLRQAGVLVRLRHSPINPGQVTGYAVGLPDHHTTTGDTIWYGGGRLAADLTLPQLRHRWRRAEPAPGGNPRREHTAGDGSRTYRAATQATRRATTTLADGGIDQADDVSATAYAIADLLTCTARAVEGRRVGPLTEAAEILDQAVREPHRRRPGRSRPAGDLRSMARLISAMGRLSHDRDTAAALHLVLQISMFADHLADLRHAQQRTHQARAARRAGYLLSRYAAGAGHVDRHRLRTSVTVTQRTERPAAGRSL